MYAIVNHINWRMSSSVTRRLCMGFLNAAIYSTHGMYMVLCSLLLHAGIARFNDCHAIQHAEVDVISERIIFMCSCYMTYRHVFNFGRRITPDANCTQRTPAYIHVRQPDAVDGVGGETYFIQF